MLMFSGKLFTIVSVVLAVAVNGSPIEVANNVCNNVPEGFDNDISSFAPSSWMSCTLFEYVDFSGCYRETDYLTHVCLRLCIAGVLAAVESPLS